MRLKYRYRIESQKYSISTAPQFFPGYKQHTHQNTFHTSSVSSCLDKNVKKKRKSPPKHKSFSLEAINRGLKKKKKTFTYPTVGGIYNRANALGQQTVWVYYTTSPQCKREKNVICKTFFFMNICFQSHSKVLRGKKQEKKGRSARLQ